MTDATPDLPDGPFDVIYADPPWSYDRGGESTSDVRDHYSVMDLDDIKSLDVPAADDAVLYLWSTSPHLAEAIEVISAWGFEYKTSAVWDKQTDGRGLGFWFRIDHELLLVAARGDAKPPDAADRRSSLFSYARGEHSAKPEAVRTHIEQAHPDARKLEMFSRDGKVGWELWGDESPDSKQATLGESP